MSPTFTARPSYAIDLLRRLATIADKMVESREVQISDAALRQLTEEVRSTRESLTEAGDLIGYEASCLLECIAALAYARSAKDQAAEERAKMYINCFRVFVRGDADIAQRRLERA